jgi:hypothetical protein
MGTKMMRVCFFEGAGYGAAFHAFVSAIRRGFGVCTAAQANAFASLSYMLGFMFAFSRCTRGSYVFIGQKITTKWAKSIYLNVCD